MIPRRRRARRALAAAAGGAAVLAALVLIGRELTASKAPAPAVALGGRALKPGEAVLVTVTGQRDDAPPSGRFAGQDLLFFRASTGTYLALAGLDLEVSTGSQRLALELKAPGWRFSRDWSLEVFVDSASFATSELKVAERFVTPRPDEEARAESEALYLKAVLSAEGPRPLFSGRFAAPIPGAASSRFGERRMFNGQLRAPHSGADLRAGRGASVRAPADGRVVLAEDLFYLGRAVVLDHGLGLMTVYGHLSKTSVAVGEAVARGRELGRVGATGRATGPHLHWGVVLRGARVDPFSLMWLDNSLLNRP